jgi:spoIIIJ-associated protein
VSESTASETDLPGAAGPERDLPEADLPDADVPEADVPEADVPEADLSGTDVPERSVHEGADLSQPVRDSPAAVEASTDGESVAPEVPASGPSDSDELARLENEGDIAADYLEELLDIADLDGDLDMDVEGDRAAVSIVGGDVRLLVGREGEVLEALQELTRLAVYRETGERSRLMLDVGGFRADKRARLEKVAAEAVTQVQASGERMALDPMSPFERKVVHDVVAAAGLSSASEGQEPRRYVVVLPR